ncbi:hypothetical protein CMI47_21865 [Candidatus Pacearchaeota archaeon]|nr:hypothetical protein [Candidatus Pacearchaeota archaeon]
MKVTRQALRQMIMEEVSDTLSDGDLIDFPGSGDVEQVDKLSLDSAIDSVVNVFGLESMDLFDKDPGALEAWTSQVEGAKEALKSEIDSAVRLIDDQLMDGDFNDDHAAYSVSDGDARE